MSGKSDRYRQNTELTYRCGRCNLDIPYLMGEEPPIPCPECGWAHKTRRTTDIPSQVKISLSQYGG